jgi:pentapeptide MXKDX repeat protein
MSRIGILSGFCGLVLVVGLGAIGCSSSTTKPETKMDKMSEKKDDKMEKDKMSPDKMSGDKMEKDKMEKK